MTWADCRLCIYFRKLEEMGQDEVRRAEEWVRARRPGAELLGYCDAFHRPVTYYTGLCRGFKRKPVRMRSLMEFFDEG